MPMRFSFWLHREGHSYCVTSEPPFENFQRTVAAAEAVALRGSPDLSGARAI